MTTATVTTLGGTASHIKIGKVGLGTMMMTWKQNPTPEEICFETIKSAINKVGADAKLLLCTGEFYGTNPRTANLELLARFFEKYPELTDRVFISVKGGTNRQYTGPDASPENLRASVDACLAALNGKKRIDLFECARVDQNITIEESMKTLVALSKEGKFDHIGLSECSAETLKRASKIHPVTCVEIEVSIWSYEDETKKVISTANELGTVVVAYSPLGRGFLTGKRDPRDFQDFRARLQRFQPENVDHNLKLVRAIEAAAERKGVTAAQLCIAWVSSCGSWVVPMPGSSSPERAEENLDANNISLSTEDLEEISKIMASHEVKGGRYTGGAHDHLWG